ncbi:MAG: hypothetical protein R3258_06620 [Acidimicrobiia bacterium]|nr:hypothetical protein [Acidimicrobiia bacterium]
MSRLARFEAYRYVGVRDTMRVYDCDDPSQFQTLSERVASDDLAGRNLLQAFSPDSPEEAASRGFKPA